MSKFDVIRAMARAAQGRGDSYPPAEFEGEFLWTDGVNAGIGVDDSTAAEIKEGVRVCMDVGGAEPIVGVVTGFRGRAGGGAVIMVDDEAEEDWS